MVALPDYALNDLRRGTEVRLADLGENSVFLGIAACVRDRLFAYPEGAGRLGEVAERDPMNLPPPSISQQPFMRLGRTL